MKAMQGDDISFTKLMARWVMQSEYSFGRSGGKTKLDTDSTQHQNSPFASFLPYEPTSTFKNFPKLWTKQHAFKQAEPYLSIIFSAASQKYGKNWPLMLNAAAMWYQFGVKDYLYSANSIKSTIKTFKMKEMEGLHTVFYGRDTITFYRVMRNHFSCSYVEGMSRPITRTLTPVDSYDLISEQNTDKARTIIRFLKNNLSSKDPEVLDNILDKVLHVDTGFAGTIPLNISTAALVVSNKYANNDKLRLLSNLPELARDRILMLSATKARWDLGFNRSFITKFESRPKFFYRPAKWVPLSDVTNVGNFGFGTIRLGACIADLKDHAKRGMGVIDVEAEPTRMDMTMESSNMIMRYCAPNSEVQVPEFRITGDAAYAAVYNIGFRAAAEADNL